MTLLQYHTKLTAILKQHPNTADLQVIAASDDEGNQFNPVIYDPALGYHDDNGDFDTSSKNPNVVCIN
jgi:hypothetical protein